MSPYDDRIEFRRGIPESYREEAARLFDEAFGSKFRGAVDKEKRIQLFRETLQLEHGIGAVSEGKLLGIAGLETEAGSFSGGFTFAKFVQCLGLPGAAWSMMVLSLFHSRLGPGELHLDDLAVSKEARGKGIGSHLLDDFQSDCGKPILFCIDFDLIEKMTPDSFPA
ncbi:MAG: GNAT family N-acetyltransferase, partial [Verrucomicrobiota bacterium]